jgi:hypothetical protein
MLPTRNVNDGIGRCGAPGTFVNDGPNEERAHPHFYCGAATLVSLFSVELLSLSQSEQKSPAPGTGTSSPSGCPVNLRAMVVKRFRPLLSAKSVVVRLAAARNIGRQLLGAA